MWFTGKGNSADNRILKDLIGLGDYLDESKLI